MKTVWNTKYLTWDSMRQTVTVHVNASKDITLHDGDKIRSTPRSGFGGYEIKDLNTGEWCRVNKQIAGQIARHLKYMNQSINYDWFVLEITPFCKSR